MHRVGLLTSTKQRNSLKGMPQGQSKLASLRLPSQLIIDCITLTINSDYHSNVGQLC